ncbi:MAG: transposase [Nitrosotalea sp.]
MLKCSALVLEMDLYITKCVKQKYVFEDRQLFADFRWMINEAIRIGIKSRITSKLALRNLVYEQFKNDYNTSFINMAVFKAHAILKNYRRMLKKKYDIKQPYVKKRFAIVDSCHIRLNGKLLSFSIKPRQFINILLNDHVTTKLSQPDIKIGNIIIRDSEIVIPYTIKAPEQESCGHIGIDMNFENIATSDSENKVEVYDISDITNYKMKIRERLSHFTRNDVRIKRRLTQKYGKKQRDKEHNLLHNLANNIVSTKMTPVMEHLTYIRNQGRKGDYKGKRFRFRLNSWSRFKLQHIIDYKSRQNGTIPIYVNPKGTSSKCSICGSKLVPEENRKMHCFACAVISDRDVNAARNILHRGLRFKPIASQGEGMKQSKDVDPIVMS